MKKQKFAEQVAKNILSKKGIEKTHKVMSKGTSKTKRKYYKVGDIIGYIEALEANVMELTKRNGALTAEIGKLTKQLSKYNLNTSPNGIEGYIFFDQDEYNGLKHLEKDMEKVIHDIKRDIIRKYWSSQLAAYGQGK